MLGLTDLEPGTYLNHFHCVPAAAPRVPSFQRKPTAPQAQTALVVGLAGEPLTTDRDHRVKVQFAWQRGAQPHPGGLAHASAADAKGNAPGNEQSGTWVRVAQPAAGANWGAVYTPRVGTEVAIGFVDSDIDRPIRTARCPSLVERSIEERMPALQARKAALAEGVLGSDAAAVKFSAEPARSARPAGLMAHSRIGLTTY